MRSNGGGVSVFVSLLSVGTVKEVPGYFLLVQRGSCLWRAKQEPKGITHIYLIDHWSEDHKM